MRHPKAARPVQEQALPPAHPHQALQCPQSQQPKPPTRPRPKRKRKLPEPAQAAGAGGKGPKLTPGRPRPTARATKSGAKPGQSLVDLPPLQHTLPDYPTLVKGPRDYGTWMEKPLRTMLPGLGRWWSFLGRLCKRQYGEFAGQARLHRKEATGAQLMAAKSIELWRIQIFGKWDSSTDPNDPPEMLILNLSPGGKIHQCRTDLSNPQQALHPRHWRFCSWPFARDNALFSWVDGNMADGANDASSGLRGRVRPLACRRLRQSLLTDSCSEQFLNTYARLSVRDLHLGRWRQSQVGVIPALLRVSDRLARNATLLPTH